MRPSRAQGALSSFMRRPAMKGEGRLSSDQNGRSPGLRRQWPKGASASSRVARSGRPRRRVILGLTAVSSINTNLCASRRILGRQCWCRASRAARPFCAASPVRSGLFYSNPRRWMREREKLFGVAVRPCSVLKGSVRPGIVISASAPTRDLIQPETAPSLLRQDHP